MQFENLKNLKIDYSKSNFFNEKFDTNIRVINLKINPLLEMFYERLNSSIKIDKVIDSGNISSLHENISKELTSYDLQFGINKLSNFFYDMPSNFKTEYIKTLKKDLRDQVNFDFYFQENPTIRVQTPDENSNKFYPFYHSDVQLGHPPYEINLWFPLNEPHKEEGHGFVVCNLEKSSEIFSAYDFDIDYLKQNKKKIAKEVKDSSKMIDCNLGQGIVFDSRCLHSTIPLKDHTRVSIDVRIMPKEIFKSFSKIYYGTGRRKVKFVPGDAYSNKTIDEF